MRNIIFNGKVEVLLQKYSLDTKHNIVRLWAFPEPSHCLQSTIFMDPASETPNTTKENKPQAEDIQVHGLWL